MPRKPRWYDALPAATTTVDCGGERHVVAWRRGKVVLLAHDLSAERGILAFGGELCQCMRVLEMWMTQFRMAPEQFLALRTWLGPNADLAPIEFDVHRRLGMILNWDRSWRQTFHFRVKQAQLLADELKARASAPLREHVNAWKPKTGARVVSGCQVELVPADQPVMLEGGTDRVALKAKAQLHGRWLIEVWPRGIAVVDDAFVLDVTKALTGDDLEVVAARWTPTGTGTWSAAAEPARLRRDDGEWHLTWDRA